MFALSNLLAFFSLGPGEMVVIMIVGLLVFGRRLPEVGRQFGRTFLEFRKGLNSFRQEMDLDHDLRDTRNTMRELHREVTRPLEIEPWSRSSSYEQVEPANPDLHYDHGEEHAPPPVEEGSEAAAAAPEPTDEGAPFEDRREHPDTDPSIK